MAPSPSTAASASPTADDDAALAEDDVAGDENDAGGGGPEVFVDYDYYGTSVPVQACLGVLDAFPSIRDFLGFRSRAPRQPSRASEEAPEGAAAW